MENKSNQFTKTKPQIIDQVLAQLGTYHPLSQNLHTAFMAEIFFVDLKEGEHLMREHEICPNIYFLTAGIVSGYKLKGKKKIVTFITVSGELLSPISGMYGTGPAGENMVAENDCHFIAIKVNTLFRFYELYPEMNIVVRKIMESHYKNAHERAVINKMGTAKEKYNYYLNFLPNHHHLISTTLAANFLGIKPQTLLNIQKEQQQQQQLLNRFRHQVERLNHIMEIDLVFQQKKLSLKYLANLVKLNSHQLSSIINEHYQQNFTDFINTHRVNYIKKQLKYQYNFEQTTIEALGYSAGFSSKSTFFAVFKKQTGLSPFSFAQTLQEKKMA